jgi:hypothetical protein
MLTRNLPSGVNALMLHSALSRAPLLLRESSFRDGFRIPRTHGVSPNR